MGEPILIWGSGAIGGTVGAFLARAGRDVLMVDVVSEHVAHMQANGLAIEGPVDCFSASVEAASPEEVRGRFGRILLAVKSQHTEAAVTALAPHLADGGHVVSLQNGLNERLIARRIGAARTIGCFVNFGADYVAPGKILYGGRGALVLGELDARITERLLGLRAVMQSFEPDAQVTNNIFGYLWAKLAFTAVLLAQTLSNEPTEDFLDDSHWRPLIYRLVQEIALVARAEGVSLMPFQGFDPRRFLCGGERHMKAAIDGYANARRGSRKLHSGIWRDIVIRKRPTEMAHQGATVLQAAARHGIDVPTYTRALHLIAEAEAGRAELGGALPEELLGVARAAGFSTC